MNDSNPLESALRSWKPRRPSVALESRIFAAQSPTAATEDSGLGVELEALLRRLAPTMICLILVAIAGTRSSHLGGLVADGLTNQLPSLLSSQNYAAYLMAGFHSGQNAISAERFKWTKGTRASSSSASFILMNTNGLLR